MVQVAEKVKKRSLLIYDWLLSVVSDDVFLNTYDRLLQTYGKLNILFNNAGISHADDDGAVTTSEDVWDLTFRINVKVSSFEEPLLTLGDQLTLFFIHSFTHHHLLSLLSMTR